MSEILNSTPKTPQQRAVNIELLLKSKDWQNPTEWWGLSCSHLEGGKTPIEVWQRYDEDSFAKVEAAARAEEIYDANDVKTRSTSFRKS